MDNIDFLIRTTMHPPVCKQIDTIQALFGFKG